MRRSRQSSNEYLVCFLHDPSDPTLKPSITPMLSRLVKCPSEVPDYPLNSQWWMYLRLAWGVRRIWLRSSNSAFSHPLHPQSPPAHSTLANPLHSLDQPSPQAKQSLLLRSPVASPRGFPPLQRGVWGGEGPHSPVIRSMTGIMTPSSSSIAWSTFRRCFQTASSPRPSTSRASPGHSV